METVHIASGDYERYEELTLKKDQYEKEADIYESAYTREFGELINEGFKLRIDCIALKKEINVYVRAKNRGETVDPAEVAKYIEQQMAGYRDELDDMIRRHKQSQQGKVISEYEYKQIKALYRKLAKILHPDISPLIQDYPQFGELFNQVIRAYKLNDLKGLQALEVIINKEMEDNGIEGFNVVIDDIEDRIEELERDIADIINSAPYNYKYILDNDDAIKEKKEELQSEIDEYTKYKAELEEKLNAIKEDM